MSGMHQSTRLVVNTLATFSRMVLTVGLGLITTRLLLQALGEIDFGLLTTLGATGTLLALVTRALIQSTQRHLAYEIGRGDRRQISRTFSTAQLMFLLTGAGLWALGFALTPVVMRGLTIPEPRLDAAWWVYQITLLGLLRAVVTTPFESIIAAHQELVFSTIFELANAMIRLSVAFGLFYVSGDNLVMFALLYFLGSLLVTVAMATLCLKRYPESRPYLRDIGWAEMRELASFAGWSFLGAIAWSMRQRGAMILLNVAFGPVVNAAYAVASQVQNYTNNLSLAIGRAVTPAVVSMEARGNRSNVHRLTLVNGKYTFMMLSLVFIPMWIEMPTVLGLWLDKVPEHTTILVRLTLVWALMQSLVSGYGYALHATGDIGWWTRILLMLAIASLGMAVAAIYLLGQGPWSVPASTIVLVCVQVPLTVSLIGRRIGLSIRDWLSKSLLKVIIVAGPATVAATGVSLGLADSPWRVLAVFSVYVLCVCALIWPLGIERWERDQFRRMARLALNRLPFGRNKTREQ